MAVNGSCIHKTIDVADDTYIYLTNKTNTARDTNLELTNYYESSIYYYIISY